MSPEIAAVRLMPRVCAVVPDRFASLIRASRSPAAAAGSARSGTVRRLERQRDRVDAPPLVGRHLVAFALEDVAEVGVAVGAPHLGPDRAERPVLDQHDSVPLGRLVEAGPAAVGLELGVGGEQLGAAGAALIDAPRLGVGVFAGKWRLGARSPEHLVLLRGQPLTPFFLGKPHVSHDAETTCLDAEPGASRPWTGCLRPRAWSPRSWAVGPRS